MPTNQVRIHLDQPVRISSFLGVSVREDVAYTNQKGEEKSGIRKRAEKALDKLEEPLRKLLEPDEAVLYVAKGQIMPSGIDQLFLGWHSYYLAPAVLIFTNRRLLHILVNRNGTWKRSVRNARWGNFEEAKVKGWLSAKLYVKYKDGKKEIYWGLGSGDGKKIKAILEAILPNATGETSSALTITSLCPECRTPLTPGIYQCAQCSLKFKDEGTALKRSLVIPGGGFFYTGHPFLGVAHFLVDLFLPLAVVYWGLAAAGIVTPEPDPGQPPPERGAIVTVFVVFALFLAAHKALSARIARNLVRNYIPIS